MPVPVAAATLGGQLLRSGAQTGSSGLISGAIGQLFAGMNARRQWKYTQKQMALQQKYALEQMQKQAEYEYGNWQKQFDYENSWNEPSKVFERYRSAGVTPAAVLGSSGVGINATMSGGSVGSVGASGPSGGFSSPGAGPLDMQAVSQAMLTDSVRERNNAAAARDRADAENIENSTHEAGFQKLYDSAQIALMRAQEKRELSTTEYQSAQKALMDFDIIVKQWTLGGEISAVLADYQTRINEAKAGNIQNEYLRKQLDSQLLLTWSMFLSNMADVGYKDQLRRLTASQVVDLQNEIANNWSKRWQIKDKDGNVKTYSLKDLYGMLTLADVNAAAWKPAEAEQRAGKAAAERTNEEYRWKWETLDAVVSIVQALMFRGGMRGFGSSSSSSTMSTGESSQTSRTTVLDASGNPKGYVIREMSGSSNSNGTGWSRHQGR
nr:MAG TPA: hypothetical protein [Microviridae sp.]